MSKTSSERLFEYYLSQHRYRYRYEPCHMKKAAERKSWPDFIVRKDKILVLCEVKELADTPYVKGMSNATRDLMARIKNLRLLWGLSLYWEPLFGKPEDSAPPERKKQFQEAKKIFEDELLFLPKLIALSCNQYSFNDHVPTEFLLPHRCDTKDAQIAEIRMYSERITWDELRTYAKQEIPVVAGLLARVCSRTPDAVAFTVPNEQGRYPRPRLLREVFGDSYHTTIAVAEGSQGVIAANASGLFFGCASRLGARILPGSNPASILGPVTMYRPRHPERFQAKINKAKDNFKRFKNRTLPVPCVVVLDGGDEIIDYDDLLEAAFGIGNLTGAFQKSKNTSISALCLLAKDEISCEPKLTVLPNPHCKTAPLPDNFFV